MPGPPADAAVRLDEELREAVARVLPRARARGCHVGVLVRDGLPSGLSVHRATLQAELDELLSDAVERSPERMMVVLESAGFDARMRARARAIVLMPTHTSTSWNGAFDVARAPSLSQPVLPDPGTRVLVVDDDPVARELLGAMLGRIGLQVQTAEDGCAALQHLQDHDHDVDVVLLDMAMPHLSGPEVARTARERGLRLPILGVSANRFADDREDCVGAGMNDYLSKPVLPDSLYRMVERWTRS